ncbi:hypothetical protein SprV_0502001100 [Sparganum proliferum]
MISPFNMNRKPRVRAYPRAVPLKEITLTDRTEELKLPSPAFDVYEPLHTLPYSAATLVAAVGWKGAHTSPASEHQLQQH